ncbi:unnamed protein product [Rotaria magnacalcarata]|uniref:Histone-binding protein RBBP4-like N-terminal domain-containing protein n=1 Tax=Rotaria magnacalcarata TaxID=392030 RepID=A0A819J6L9_9BILA|nr:unnamed protein product [Rotaria magnacalcarata]CAF2116610.1 unnamed protein product [Rotaria magnacalcarata]CAF3898584.1 unnamed protein product [Rotaria magnacalcarata]CAF3922694.1 unnamed protein product [Rotaria magnacalcarata]
MELEPIIVPIEENDSEIQQLEDDIESDGYDQLFQSTEFCRWRKNAPYLYNMLFYELLECPSPTVQWLDQHTVKGDLKCDYYRLIIGTQGGRTPTDSRNELIVVEMRLPMLEYDFSKQPDQGFDELTGEHGGYEMGIRGSMHPYAPMYHVGDVNKSRAMPQNTFKIASFSSINDIFLFDYSKHPSKLNPDGKCRPQAILRGHTDEGFALSWHPMQQGLLLSGAQDGKMCVWNLEKMPNSSTTTTTTAHNGIECNTIIDPVEIIDSQRKLVDAIQWHPSHPAVFGAAAASGTLLITDLRASSGTATLIDPLLSSTSSSTSGSKTLQFRVKVHAADCNCLAFHPANEYAVLTGSDDATIALWDMRNLSKEIRRFEQRHHDGVLEVAWSPIAPTVFASSSADRHVLVWDIKSNDGVIFDHKGHDARIPDISWHPTRPMIASVAEDSSFQIWEANIVDNLISSI